MKQTQNLRLVDTAAEIDLSDCMQPDASPEMVAYITWLQTEFITDILRSHRGQGYNREEKHYFFVLYFEKLVIPVLEELTFLNRNPLGNAFIKKTYHLDCHLVTCIHQSYTILFLNSLS